MDFTRADVAHLLRRAGFGGSPAEIDDLTALASWAAVVDRVLDTTATFPDFVPPAVDDRVEPNYGPWVAGVHHWMDRMVTSPTPIVEKMTLFWHGHFTSGIAKAPLRQVFRQVSTYRRLALGDLDDLAQAMAVEPAMLKYLDNDANVAGRPNENFAREVMELFLLGRDGYQEQDVPEMARAWSGHRYDASTESYRWVPSDHDDGTKQIFGITRRWDGPETLTEMIRGSKQQVCARHIARHVWAYLAGPPASTATLGALTAAFTGSGMQVKELVRAVFLHPEFRSPATRTGLVRSPADWMAATMKVLGMGSEVLRTHGYMPRAGQKLYDPPTVAGWPAGDGWVSTSTAWGHGGWADFVRWKARDAGIFEGYGNLAPATAAQGALDLFGIDDPSPVTRAAIEAFVAREQAAGRAWAVPPGLVAITMLSPDHRTA